MATLNTAFNIATGALNADQAALTVVSNNVANANTTGYTREVATFRRTIRSPSTVQSYGTGVTMTGPVSQRDLALEQALQQQGQVASASSARLTALQQVETIFNQVTTGELRAAQPSATSGIEQDMSQFFDSLSSLESSPADTSLRQQVLTSATNLAGDFQTASSQLSSQQTRSTNRPAAWSRRSTRSRSRSRRLNQQIQSSSPNADAGNARRPAPAGPPAAFAARRHSSDPDREQRH